MRSCARCNASIHWAYTSTGEALMVDADPHPDGSIELVSAPDGLRAIVHDQPDLLGAPRHRFHKLTCSLMAHHQAPYVAGSDTSKAAADSLDGKQTSRDRDRILTWLLDHGPATDEQIAEALDLNPSTARPRRLELAEEGLIYHYGDGKTRSGRKAHQWAAVVQEALIP